MSLAASAVTASPAAPAIISPINSDMQQQVIAEVRRYLTLAGALFDRSFDVIPVLFDLKGRTAGMYRVRRQGKIYERSMRFNPWLFSKYPKDSWDNTIPHEVAHYVAESMFGLKTIKPHGREWQAIMRKLGAEPIVRANYDLSDIPTRQVRRYRYVCQCREVPLTTYRHKKIQQGLQRYRCRECGVELSYLEQQA